MDLLNHFVSDFDGVWVFYRMRAKISLTLYKNQTPSHLRYLDGIAQCKKTRSRISRLGIFKHEDRNQGTRKQIWGGGGSLYFLLYISFLDEAQPGSALFLALSLCLSPIHQPADYLQPPFPTPLSSIFSPLHPQQSSKRRGIIL